MLDDTCADLARTYVEEQRLTVTEIAFVLGFADTSGFSRAFERWTGMSPRHWARTRRRAGRARRIGERSGLSGRGRLTFPARVGPW